jgi:hypothetical protein
MVKKINKEIWEIVRTKKYIVTLEFDNQMSAKEVFEIFKKLNANNLTISERLIEGIKGDKKNGDTRR